MEQTVVTTTTEQEQAASSSSDATSSVDNENKEIMSAAEQVASSSSVATSSVSVENENQEIMSAASNAFDVRMAVVGNVDAGKSTLIGVLTSGTLDDGRGLARSKVFMHAHEAASGRTSSISQHIMGFDVDAQPVHQQAVASAAPAVKTKAWQKVVAASNTIVTFVDLAGHERYLKTTIAGLTGSFPDYVMIVVNSLAGISKMTKEHLGVVLALNLPFTVVVTKVDMCPANVLARTKKQLNAILKHQQVGKMPCVCRSHDDVDLMLQKITVSQSHRMCPVFYVSNVSGDNVDVLTHFIAGLHTIVRLTMTSSSSAIHSPVMSSSEKENATPATTTTHGTDGGDGGTGKDKATTEDHGVVLSAAATARQLLEQRQRQHTEYHIDDIFNVVGVGVVVAGTVVEGVMYDAREYWLGPFHDGTYIKVFVRSVYARRTPTTHATRGQTCSVALRAVKRKEPLRSQQLRRGMVMFAVDNSKDNNNNNNNNNNKDAGGVGSYVQPRSCMRFDAEVLVLHHPTTIKRHYQAVIHCGNVRQTALIEKIVPFTAAGVVKKEVNHTLAAVTPSSEEEAIILANAIRTGDKARVTFRFLCRPEYIRVGLTFVFREGNTKGVGRVVSTEMLTSHRVNTSSTSSKSSSSTSSSSSETSAVAVAAAS